MTDTCKRCGGRGVYDTPAGMGGMITMEVICQECTAYVYLRETKHDGWGSWREIWHVSPPDAGTPYRVKRDEWDAEFNVRHIYEIER
jgi:hypothetical protein